MTVLLWVVFGLAVACWAVSALTWVWLWLTALFGSDNEAKGFVAALMLFWTLVLGLPGGLAGVWLAALLEGSALRVVVGIGGGIMLAGAARLAWQVLWGGPRHRKSDELHGPPETIPVHGRHEIPP